MPKTDNPHTIRLYQSILNYSDEETAQRIANKISLSKSADRNKKFRWAESICADLEKEFDGNTVKLIRMDCACGPEMRKIGKLKKLYVTSSTIDEFATKANQLNEGFTILHEKDSLFLIYPQCYCSCIKGIDKPISKCWCYCTLGYTKKTFEHILDKDVSVELIESVKTGGNVCKIKISY